MTVATFAQPDRTTQSGSAYPANIDASIAVLARLGQAFAPHAQGTPDMTVRVDAGFIFDGAALTEIAAQSTGTITAPVTNPRIDRVVVNMLTGAVSVVTGTEAASPVAPAIPAGFLPLCRIALATSTTSIGNSLLTDERTLKSLEGNIGLRRYEDRRQTVVAGNVDANGAANFLGVGSGLAVNLYASVPVVATFAAGEDQFGQINYRIQYSSNQIGYWSGLAASNVSYLAIDRNTSTGAVTPVATLVPPQYGYAYDRTRQMLLHFEGSGATVLDDYGNGWTAFGSATQSSAQAKFGTKSLLLASATSDYINTANGFNHNGDNWTMEGWFMFNSFPASNNPMVLGGFMNAAGYGALLALQAASGTTPPYAMKVDLSSNGTSWDIANLPGGSKTTWNTGQWYHVALVFDGATYKVYIDGVLDQTITSSVKICNTTFTRIGAQQGPALFFNGYVDEFRISPCARYTAAFTPPAAAFTLDGHFFSIPAMQMYAITAASISGGVDPGMTAVQRLYLGEAVTGASSVSSAVTYALRGRYRMPYTAQPAGATPINFSHNIGCKDVALRGHLLCITGELGFSPGDTVEFQNHDDGSNITEMSASRNSGSAICTSTGWLVLTNKATGGARTTASAANWKVSIDADRTW